MVMGPWASSVEWNGINYCRSYIMPLLHLAQLHHATHRQAQFRLSGQETSLVVITEDLTNSEVGPTEATRPLQHMHGPGKEDQPGGAIHGPHVVPTGVSVEIVVNLVPMELVDHRWITVG